MANTHVLFAKQPIFDANLTVSAYEILFRSGTQNHADVVDGDHATSHVILYAFGQHKIEDIIGRAPAYINFTRNLLVFPPPLPPDRLVIEVLEDVTPDEQVLQGLANLRAQGYKIALDDFFLTKETRQLLAYADIIKVDVLALTPTQLKAYVDHLHPLKLTLLAEKIETYQMFEQCKALGFDLFQGYFLSKPTLVTGLKIEASKKSVLRLLATLTEPTVDIKTIADVIASDPRLSLRILKIVNSTAIKTANSVHSLTQAASLLGINQIRNWAMLLIIAGSDDKPVELGLLSMTRAKFGEQIGCAIDDKSLGEMCFTTGVLSTFDAFLDLPMPELLKKLPLSKNLIEGLSSTAGVNGRILHLTKMYESANWQAVDKLIAEPPLNKITESMLNAFYAEAASWARSIMKQI